jgi:hypothetical protein
MRSWMKTAGSGEILRLLLLDAPGDGVEHLHAFERVFADGGLAGEHHAVGLLVDGVGDVGDLGAAGHGLADHGLEHVRGDDDGRPIARQVRTARRWMTGSSRSGTRCRDRRGRS